MINYKAVELRDLDEMRANNRAVSETVGILRLARDADCSRANRQISKFYGLYITVRRICNFFPNRLSATISRIFTPGARK